MQVMNSTGYDISASNVRNLSGGRGPGPRLKRYSIVEAERRGNLVIASLAFCLLGGVMALAVT